MFLRMKSNVLQISSICHMVKDGGGNVYKSVANMIRMAIGFVWRVKQSMTYNNKRILDHEFIFCESYFLWLQFMNDSPCIHTMASPPFSVATSAGSRKEGG